MGRDWGVMARRPVKAQLVAEQIRADLAGSPPGTWLPTWDELSDRHAVARGTIDNARKILVEQGVIELVPNRGARTVVRAGFPRGESDHARVVNGERGWAVAAREAGHEPWHELTKAEDVAASEEVALHLGVPLGTTVLLRARVHGVVEGDSRVPLMLSWTWLSPAMAEQLPVLREQSTGDGGMTSRFQELGLRLRWQTIGRPRALSADEGEALRLPAGTPVMDLWRRCYDQDGRVLEVTRRVVSAAVPVVFEWDDSRGV